MIYEDRSHFTPALIVQWESAARSEENWNSEAMCENLEFRTLFWVRFKCEGLSGFYWNQDERLRWMFDLWPCSSAVSSYSPRGALRPVTSSRPRRRRSLNSVSFICWIKAPTFRPFLGFRIFISQVGIQCRSLLWQGVQKKLCIPAWNSSLNHKVRYNCEEGPKYPHLKKSPHSVGWW